MTPERFEEGRRALGLSVRQLAKVFDVTPRKVREWIDDDYKRGVVPGVAGRLMAWLAFGEQPPLPSAKRGRFRREETPETRS